MHHAKTSRDLVIGYESSCEVKTKQNFERDSIILWRAVGDLPRTSLAADGLNECPSAEQRKLLAVLEGL